MLERLREKYRELENLKLVRMTTADVESWSEMHADDTENSKIENTTPCAKSFWNNNLGEKPDLNYLRKTAIGKRKTMQSYKVIPMQNNASNTLGQCLFCWERWQLLFFQHAGMVKRWLIMNQNYILPMQYKLTTYYMCNTLCQSLFCEERRDGNCSFISNAGVVKWRWMMTDQNYKFEIILLITKFAIQSNTNAILLWANAFFVREMTTALLPAMPEWWNVGWWQFWFKTKI